ncbi:hypothetical protein RIF29_21275 [Crotalaria pallida]|uniref:Protein kinase domain-containing protein n=1 Tax=Crotalaria pallida TaxID=3830 RepID=A0AAN9F2P9_CROPI
MQVRKLISMAEMTVERRGGRVFTAEELKKATNNYDKDRIIYQLGFGSTYKGVLSNNRVVAITKYKRSGQNMIEHLIKEVNDHLRLSHRNVINLIGCCLETQVPLLVFQYFTNGTLHDYLHSGEAPKLSWTTRLRVAAETADALAYLHSVYDYAPILIHGDVKSANIFLDNNLTAKVFEFGISKKFGSLGEAELTTGDEVATGTIGYLDPEYFHIGELTDKSDVYSFGVVLAELLTGKKAIVYSGHHQKEILSTNFVYSISEGCLWQILDNDIVNDANLDHVTMVANLAKKCLNLKGEERPRMRDVARELERIIRSEIGNGNGDI